MKVNFFNVKMKGNIVHSKMLLRELSELGEVSFGMLKLGGLGEAS